MMIITTGRRFVSHVPVASLLAVGVLGTACARGNGDAATAGPVWSIETAPVLFTGRREGRVDLYRLDGGATAPVRLTSDSGSGNYGRYAPDGSRIAFQSRRTGKIDIYVMDADGSAAVNFTNHPDYDVLPAWSPDGRQLAFMSTRGYEMGTIGPFPGHIYVAEADGANLRPVTREPLTSSLGPGDWTPDGSGLLLSRNVEGSLDLFLLDIETGDETRLTGDPADEYGGSVSHDGTRVAFHAESNGVAHIVVMNIDGTGRRIVTAGPGLRYSPRWSPDDTWVIFNAQGTGEADYDIRAVRVADGEERPMVVTPEDEREPEWVPAR